MVTRGVARASSPPSRRGLLLAAGAGLAGAVLAGCGKRVDPGSRCTTRKPRARHATSTSSTTCSTSSTWRSRRTPPASRCWRPTMAKAGALFLNDELSHAGDLAGLVREAGGKPIKPAPSYALGHPRNSRGGADAAAPGRAGADRRRTSTRSRGSSPASSSSRWPRSSPTTPSTSRSCACARAAGDPVGVRDRTGVIVRCPATTRRQLVRARSRPRAAAVGARRVGRRGGPRPPTRRR